MPQNLIRLPEVIKRTGLSRSNIYLKISKGEFPSQISLGDGARSVAFIDEEISLWIAGRIKASRPDTTEAK